jgi:hypothetical protein
MPSMRIDRITLLPELQFREDSRNHQGLANPERVKEYAEAMERGEDFPPVRVVEDGKTRWLVDGFHTLAAYVRLGKTMVPVETIEGNLEVAHREAWKANSRRGAEYTPGDKRNKLLDLFRWQEWYDKPLREVAELTSISEHHCRNVRRDAPVPEFGFSATVTENQPLMRSEEESDEEATEESLPEEQPKRKRGRPPGGTAARESRERRQQATVSGNGPPAPAARKERVLDQLGQEVPERLIPTFRDPVLEGIADVLEEQAAALKGADNWAYFVRRADFILKLEGIVENLRGAVPYALCPKCRGAGCKRCRNAGFLPRDLYEELVRHLELENPA